jgi:hypothetical protein
MIVESAPLKEKLKEVTLHAASAMGKNQSSAPLRFRLLFIFPIS